MVLGSLVSIVIAIALVGLVCWAVTYFIPMPDKFKTAIYVVCGVGLLLWLLSVFGMWNGFNIHK